MAWEVVMKKKFFVVVALFALVAASQAQIFGVSVGHRGVSVGVGLGVPVYSPPVVYAPRPVVYSPPPVYSPPASPGCAPGLRHRSGRHLRPATDRLCATTRLLSQLL